MLRVPSCFVASDEGFADCGGVAGRAFAYDLNMRRFFLCFLLCLMPLRLWAGVWMPMSESASHHPSAVTMVSSAQRAQADAVHDCHEAMAVFVPEAHATHVQPAAQPYSDVQNAACHDGTCQLCGVCHQSASLAAWPLVLPVFQVHPLPVGASLAYLALTVPPLTKPPIS